jgi:hypothetical protein
MRQANVVKWCAISSVAGLVGCNATVYHEERVVYRPAPPPVVVVEPPAVVVERPPEVVVTTFEADLAPYGDWVVVGSYGRCWRPRGVVATWRPYSVGHWVWSDYGWTWASEEQWGFATYHYGRWYADARYGWVWVPGSTWAPAWVAWRSGGGYVGWAPLGPTVAVGVNVEITEAHTRDIPAASFCFVAERDIAERRVHEHVVSVRENTTIINKTTNITHITTVNNVVVNKGVSVEKIEHDTGRKVERKSVKEVSSPAEARRLRERGEVVAYKPAKVVEAERARVTTVRQREVERSKTAEVKRTEVERTKAAEVKRGEAERARPADAKRIEAERAREAEAKRVEAERKRHEEAARPRAGETKEQAAERARREAEKEKRQGNEDVRPGR